MVKLEFSGWVEDGEEYTNVPKTCPKCGGKLWATNALNVMGILFLCCRNLKCRWAEVYSTEE